VIIPGSKLAAGAESTSPAALLPVDHEMAVKKHLDGMPLPGLLDALKARDGVVLCMDDDRLPDDKRFRAGEKQGESFAGPLFYKWRLEC
jgi:hypothetical protein